MESQVSKSSCDINSWRHIWEGNQVWWRDDPLLDVSLAELRATHGLSEGLETGFPEKLAHCHCKGGASAWSWDWHTAPDPGWKTARCLALLALQGLRIFSSLPMWMKGGQAPGEPTSGLAGQHSGAGHRRPCSNKHYDSFRRIHSSAHSWPWFYVKLWAKNVSHL